VPPVSAHQDLRCLFAGYRVALYDKRGPLGQVD
jgi:hypothetical protein